MPLLSLGTQEGIHPLHIPITVLLQEITLIICEKLFFIVKYPQTNGIQMLS